MLFVPLVYSLFELARLGIATAHSSSTYLPFVASLLSMTAIYLWVWLLRSDQNYRSLKKALAAWSYIIAYLFSLYIMGFFGVRGLWEAYSARSVIGAVAGIFWIWFGYRVLYRLWLLSEIPNQLRGSS
jgi:hypothetical protein